jgi:molybdopterin molybdotransferase
MGYAPCMLTVSEAQERVLERISPLDPLELSVTEAHGCVLAEVVTASEDLPPFATAAVDGFAVRSEDTSGAAAQKKTLPNAGRDAARARNPLARHRNI